MNQKNPPESMHCILENTVNQTLKEKCYPNYLISQKLSISIVIKANIVQCLKVNLVVTV